MLAWIDLAYLTDSAHSLRQQFDAASPFSHIELTQLIKPGREQPLSGAFPPTDWDGWRNTSGINQNAKYACSDTAQIPDPLRTLVYELNSAPFLAWLETVTGSDKLFPDPYLTGGGLHRTDAGGTLSIHTDGKIIDGAPLMRRINLVLYLNPEWSPADGGQLELWDHKTETLAKTISPDLGKCVIFKTDQHSLHGFNAPVANHCRQSLALFYYTAPHKSQIDTGDILEWRPDLNTTRSTRTLPAIGQRTLLFFARALSGTARVFRQLAR